MSAWPLASLKRILQSVIKRRYAFAKPPVTVAKQSHAVQKQLTAAK